MPIVFCEIKLQKISLSIKKPFYVKEFFNPKKLQHLPLVVELLRDELLGIPYFLLPMFAAFGYMDGFLWLTALGNWATIIIFTPILLDREK